MCHITILAGLSLVAPGAETCVVSDAHSCVFARRIALRLRVEHEADGDAARRIRTGGAEAEQSDDDDGGGGEEKRNRSHGGKMVTKEDKEENKRDGD